MGLDKVSHVCSVFKFFFQRGGTKIYNRQKEEGRRGGDGGTDGWDLRQRVDHETMRGFNENEHVVKVLLLGGFFEHISWLLREKKNTKKHDSILDFNTNVFRV